MKNALIYVLCLVIALSLLSACGKTGDAEQSGPETAAPAADADHDPDVRTYTVSCYCAETGEPVGDVVVNFCTDTACTPVTSSETGAAVFTGAPAEYHVQIVRIPEGWELAQEDTEWDAGPFDETWRIPFTATGQ